MFAHCVAFFGISYFDQTKVSWIALLVMIPVVTVPVLARGDCPLGWDSWPSGPSARPSSRFRSGALSQSKRKTRSQIIAKKPIQNH